MRQKVLEERWREFVKNQWHQIGSCAVLLSQKKRGKAEWYLQPCKLCVMGIVVNSVRIDVGRLLTWKKKKDKSVINAVTSLDAQTVA